MTPPLYLTQRGPIWYVQVPVPKAAQEALKCKTLSRSLRTRDEAEAHRLRHSVVAEFFQAIDQVTGHKPATSAADLVELARQLRATVEEGVVGSGAAWKELDATVDAYLSRRAVVLGVDESGDADLPPKELRQVRKAFSVLRDGDARMSLSELAEKWLKGEEDSDLRRGTVDDKRRHLGKFVEWAGGDIEVAEVSQVRAAAYVEDALNPWVVIRKGQPPRAISLKTKRVALNVVDQFFGWLVGRGTLTVNPFTMTHKLLRGTSRKTEASGSGRRAWRPEELLGLLKALPEGDPMFPLVAILAFAGARREDICAMRLEDVSDDAMFVQRGKTRAARRYIPVHPTIAPLIKRLRETSPDGYLIGGLLTSGVDSKRGILLGKRLLGFARSIGLTDTGLVVHGFRNSVLTHMEQKGVEVFLRQQLVGQKSPNISEATYTDPASVERRARAIAAVDYGPEVAAEILRRSDSYTQTVFEKRRKPRKPRARQ